jgi:hypothetical protein
MTKLQKVLLRVAAGVLFAWGLFILPFFVWLNRGIGGFENTVGYFIYWGSVLIPWGIGFWLVRLSLRKDVADENSRP